MLDAFFLILIGVTIFILIALVMYIIYDYINYKKSVDKSIEKATETLNITNVYNTCNIIDYASKLDHKINNVSSTLKNTIDFNHNYTSNITSNLIKFDSALNNFFHFNENNSPINKKIFEYNFTGINPSLDLLNRVNALGGMNIKTTDKYLSSNNFRICNNGTTTGESCVNLNVATNGQFHITPDNNVNSLIVNNVNNNPMAKFNYLNNDIFFGGDGSAAYPGSMKINGTDLYIKDINLINGSRSSKDGKTFIPGTLDNFNNTSLLNSDFINDLNANVLTDYIITKNNPNEIDLTKITYTLTIKLMPYITIKSNSTINIKIPELNEVHLIPNIRQHNAENDPSYGIIGTAEVKLELFLLDTSLILRTGDNNISPSHAKSNSITINIEKSSKDISTTTNKITMAAVGRTLTPAYNQINSSNLTLDRDNNAIITRT